MTLCKASSVYLKVGIKVVILLPSTIVLTSYCSNGFNFSHKNCLFFDTDNTHCLDIYYRLKVSKAMVTLTKISKSGWKKKESR